MTRLDAIAQAARDAAQSFETQAIVYTFDRYAPAEGYESDSLLNWVDKGRADDVVEIVQFEAKPEDTFNAEPTI